MTFVEPVATGCCINICPSLSRLAVRGDPWALLVGVGREALFDRVVQLCACRAGAPRCALFPIPKIALLPLVR